MAGELNLAIRLNAEQVQQALAQLQDQTAKTKNRFKEFSDGVEEVAAALRTMATYMEEGFSRMVESTARVEAHNNALNRLGAAYELVRARTNDAVTAEQAVHVQQQLTQAGYRVTGEQLATITARAREYARANGTDLNQALEQVSETLRSLSGEGLQRFGIQIHNAHTRGDAFREAITQMDGALQHAGISAQSTAESADVLRRNWQQMQDGIISRIAGWLDLGTAIRGVNDLLDGTFARMQRANGITGHDDMAGRAAAADRLNNAGARRYFGANELGRLNTHDAHQVAWYVEHGDIEGARRAMSQGQSQRDEQNARDATALAGGPANDNAAPTATERARYTPSGGGASSHHEMSAANVRAQQLLDMQKAEDIAARAALDAERAANDQRLDEQQRASVAMLEAKQLEADTALKAQQTALEEQDRMRREANEAALMAQQRLNDEQNSLSQQLNQRFAQHAELHETRAQGMAGLVEGAYNTMTGALKAHITAVALGKESIGEALKGIVTETLLNLAVESTVKAIFETAQGVAAAASGAAPVAAMHFTSAGMYAAVAAAGFAGYAGVSSLGGSATQGAGAAGFGSPGAAASTRGAGSAVNDNSGGLTIINNVNGFAMTHEGVQDAVAGATESAIARGRRIRGLQHAA